MPKSKVRKPRTGRRSKDFEHPLYPRGDGKAAEISERPGEPAKVRRQFLDAYFRINLAYANLLALRRRWKSRPPKAAERSLLRKIEAALVDREYLDNRHACRGLVATPVYRDGFTIEVLFSDAQSGRERGRVLVASSSSLCLTISLPMPVRAKLCKT